MIDAKLSSVADTRQLDTPDYPLWVATAWQPMNPAEKPVRA